MFLLFLFLESTKTIAFYLPQNQSSAAGSQAGDGFWCNDDCGTVAGWRLGRTFALLP
jgi:hypothetical protein